MGVIGAILKVLFGGGRNVLAETLEIFMENAENAGERDAAWRSAALNQLAAEFAVPRKGWFDRIMDGLNRVPRPALAFGTLGLFAAAMIDPIWFAARMQGIALVPEPLWWLMGAIVSFYFGARYQVKAQDYGAGVAASIAAVDKVTRNLRALDALANGAGIEPPGAAAGPAGGNAALADWRRANAE